MELVFYRILRLFIDGTKSQNISFYDIFWSASIHLITMEILGVQQMWISSPYRSWQVQDFNIQSTLLKLDAILSNIESAIYLSLTTI